MDTFADSQAIFQQLAQLESAGAAGVKAIIENHDALSHAESIDSALASGMLGRLGFALHGGSAGRDARIIAQRARLGRLAVTLATPYSSAI